MVLNAAVQMLREADELKQKILKFKNGTSMLQERGLWATQQQLQKIYQKVLVLDLDYSLEKKVEQDLWNVGFKQQIEALQAISKDRKNPLRSDGQAMLSWVLQAAAGFYLCLLHQICTAFKLDLPFRRRASLLGWVEGWGVGAGAGGGGAAGEPAPAAARYICQHCLVHLGDLARYRQQLRVAHTFYRHALAVSVHSGQPYNQLALVWWRRGRRLAALYWHVRSLLVRAPFPPAPANLARTLHAAASGGLSQEGTLPVLPGVRAAPSAAPPAPPARLDAHGYVNELIRAMHMIHSVEELDTAEAIVKTLSSSLPSLIASDCFEWMTLIKMTCVLIWLVQSASEEYAAEGALSDGEARAAQLAETLAASTALALALPSPAPRKALPAFYIYMVEGVLSDGEARAAQLAETLAASTALALALPSPAPRKALPALKVWLQWALPRPRALRGAAAAALWPALARTLTALAALPATSHLPTNAVKVWLQWALPRPRALRGAAAAALWPALARTLTALAALPATSHLPTNAVETAPLPEDEELHGFLPIEHALESLRFPHHAAWDSYGGRLPAAPEQHQTPAEAWACLLEPELQHRVRAARLVALGRRLAAARPDLLTHTEEDGVCTFSGVGGEEQLSAALAQLAAAPAPANPLDDSDDEPPHPPPPVIISEADFREKVREKRVGILKPQGSLERAREERALATTQEEPEPVCPELDVSEDSSKGEDKKETRKPRVNIAMAAIMRKQEETNKQVKFVTPPPTPDSTADATEKDQDKPKVIQPKAIKGLVSLPLGRKTGGILSLKDKSAGYPHLVNAEPEPPKKTEKEEKKEPKQSQGSSQNSQNYQPKRQDQPPSPNWSGHAQANAYDGPRMNFQKNYGIQNTGITYNPSYSSPTNAGGQSIRLPVVNPKEIDVRTAALQKQTSRGDLFQEGHKFGAHGYQMSGDKKNFLNDLPPRFANQYRYWQAAQDSQLADNKFRDDNFKNNSLFNQSNTTWMAPQQPQETYQQPPWWKPENPPPNFNANFSQSVNMQPNFYSPHLTTNMSNPYQNVQNVQPFNQMQNSMAQQKPESMMGQGQSYAHSAIGQPQLQTLQSIVSSANFSSSLNAFRPFPVGYDAAMYPQFGGKLAYAPPKPDASATYAANMMDAQHRNLNMNFNDSLGRDGSGGAMQNMDSSTGADAGAGAGSTYSLFSGAADPPAWAAAAHHPHQSLWSGPGPSPLERLLEQQKQMKQPPAPH